MRRKSPLHFAMRAATLVVAVAVLAGCGVKGPLRPPPKSTPAAQAPTENPATPPATTSPALPPPSIPAAK